LHVVRLRMACSYDDELIVSAIPVSVPMLVQTTAKKLCGDFVFNLYMTRAVCALSPTDLFVRRQTKRHLKVIDFKAWSPRSVERALFHADVGAPRLAAASTTALLSHQWSHIHQLNIRPPFELHFPTTDCRHCFPSWLLRIERLPRILTMPLIWPRSVSAVRGNHGQGLMANTQAFQELAKGEQTAAALERQLTAMEARIETLLAQTEEQQRLTQPQQPSGGANTSADTGTTTSTSQEKPNSA